MPTVFYNPAPFPGNENARQAVVDRLLSLDLDLTEVERAVAGVADLFAVPIAAATILDRDRQWLAVKVGLDLATTPRAVSFCGHTIHQAEPLCITDTGLDSRFAGNPLVVGAPNIRSYVGGQLIVEGRAVGALCAIGRTAMPVSEAQLVSLTELSALASSHLEAQLRGA